MLEMKSKQNNGWDGYVAQPLNCGNFLEYSKLKQNESEVKL
jgi:hypothetical protein